MEAEHDRNTKSGKEVLGGQHESKYPRLAEFVPRRTRYFGLRFWLTRPKVDVDGYWTLEDLLERLPQNTFAFEPAIVRFLLFIAALWPQEKDELASETDRDQLRIAQHRRLELIGAARMFCGLIHLHAAEPSARKALADHDLKITDADLKSLDASFFSPIGGAESLLFAPAPLDLLVKANKRLDALIAPLAIAHYFESLGWTYHHAANKASLDEYRSEIKQLATLRCAYEAVEKNVFELPHKFSYKPRGQRKAHSTPYEPRQTGLPSGDTTTLRERLRTSPHTTMLLYHLLTFDPLLSDDWSVAGVLAPFLKGERHNSIVSLSMAASKRNLQPLIQNQIITKWFGMVEALHIENGGIQRPPMSTSEIKNLRETLELKRRGRPRKH